MEKESNDSEKLIIDPEFEFLIKPSSERKKQQITSLLRLGGKARIRVWEGIVIGDTLQYRICIENKIPYDIVSLPLQDRNAAISYICASELERDDLNVEYRHYLIGQELIARKQGKGKLKMVAKETLNTISNKYEISEPTVHKYHQYAKAINHIKYDAPELAASILNEKIKISYDNLRRISMLDRSSLLILTYVLRDKNNYHIKKSEIRDILCRRDDIPLSGLEAVMEENTGPITKEEQYNAIRNHLIRMIPEVTETLTQFKALFCINNSFSEDEALLASKLADLYNILFKLQITMEVVDNG